MRKGALFVLIASVASAQPSPELTKEFQAGVDAFRLGHFDEAKAHLEKARTLDPKLPGPHRFLAAVAQAQQQWQDCIDQSAQALVLNARSVEAPETRKLHEDCRVAAGRAAFHGELGDSAAIAVVTNIPGATVKVNGLTYGGTPIAPRPITSGSLDVEIEKQGWKSAHVTVDAPAGVVTDIILDLEPDAQAPPQAQVQGPAKPTVGYVEYGCAKPGCKSADMWWTDGPLTMLVDGKPTKGGRIELAPGTHTVELQHGSTDPWRRRVRVSAGQVTYLKPEFVSTSQREHDEHVGMAFLAGGGAALAVGFAAALVSEHANMEARDIVRVETARNPADPATSVEPIRTRADLQAATDRAHTFSTISIASYGVGLAAAGVGIYYIYRGARERTDVPPPFAIAPTHGGAFIAKELRW